MPDLPAARVYFRASEYPILLEALHPATRAVVWSARVEKPDGLGCLYIPPLRRQLGHAVMMRLTTAEGRVHEQPAPAGVN